MYFKKFVSAVTSVLISLTTLTCGTSVNAEAYDASSVKHSVETTSEEGSYSSSGDCGRNINYLVLDTVLTISGEGGMYNYHSDLNKNIFGERDDITKIIVEDGITSIPSYAFYGMSALEEVVIGNDVESIGLYAFKGCGKIDKLTVGSSLESFDNIPVDSITELTFAENSNFTTIDGIIYNSDVTELVYMGK